MKVTLNSDIPGPMNLEPQTPNWDEYVKKTTVEQDRIPSDNNKYCLDFGCWFLGPSIREHARSNPR